MAFMMPVMKKDYDIFKSNRSRRTSDSLRSRKVSETKSESGGAPSPARGSLGSSPAHRSVPIMTGMSRTSSMRPPRPTRSLSCSPPVPASSPPAEKFHTRLMDKLKKTLLKKGRGDSTSIDDERSS